MMRWTPARPQRPSCPHRRLARLLARALPAGLTADASTMRPWASANFVGARHLFACSVLSADGAEPAALAATLARQLNDTEWRLPGHIVADVAAAPGSSPGRLEIEILTVED